MRLVASRAAYGLDSPREDWWDRAACKGLDGMFLSAVNGKLSRAIHICLDHCPVLAQCRRETQQFVPVLGVQAGLAWRTAPAIPGPHMYQPKPAHCGSWCAHLRRPEDSQ